MDTKTANTKNIETEEGKLSSKKSTSINNSKISNKGKLGIIFISLSLPVIVLFVFLRMFITGKTFLFEFYHVFVSILIKLWVFFTTPSIFITLSVLFLLVFIYRDKIVNELKNFFVNKDGFGATFEKPPVESSEKSIIEPLGNFDVVDYFLKTFTKEMCELILDFDKKNLTTTEWIDKLESIKFSYHNYSKFSMNEWKSYYAGILRSIQSSWLFKFYNVTLTEDKKSGYFELKKGIRERIKNYLEKLEGIE
jgi:hypothetical protein